MAKLRTDEEKAAILEHCLELEESGGDILGYLWSQDYYTPRATWCNYQREWLGRKPYQYTDGKPKKKKGERKMKHAKVTLEHKKKAVEIALAGGDPLKYLKDHGAGNAPAMWYTIKEILKDKEPETYAKLPDLRAKGNRRKPETVVKDGVEYEKAEEPTLADAMTGMKDAADKFFGACDEMGLKMDKPKQQKITQPVNYDGMMIREVEGLFGRYRRTDIGSATYIDYESKDGADELSMTVEHWKAFIVEIRNAGRILGVEV
jgi:hypothetical protein